MKIVIISGSQRRQSASARVAHYISRCFFAITGVSSSILDLGEVLLPAWDDSFDSSQEPWCSIANELRDADAFVVISPEWGGMVPGALKNFLLLCSQGEIAHRPACLVGVSGSSGGAYPIAELRMSGYKNTHVCYIPEHIIVRNVDEMLGEDLPTSPGDKSLRARIDYVLRLLVVYADAFRAVRASGHVDLARYPYGM